jgi:protein TonB
MRMSYDNKIISKVEITAFSCLAIAVAVGANILLFGILAVARTTPSPAYPKEYESIQIVALDTPEPTSVEPAGRETVTDIVQLGEEPTDTDQSQPAEDMTSPDIPRLAARIDNAAFQLPGLPINKPDVSLLQPERNAPARAAKKATSASKVDRLPAKIAGPLPRYPQWARRRNLEAVVTVRFIVTVEGTVEDVKINEIDGDERFGAEAIRASSQWRFRPAIKNGKPVPCWCFQKISFEFTQ